MERYSIKSRNSILPVLTIILVLILITGITFAWLTQVLNGTRVNRITAGALSLVLDDNASNGINIENGLPQSNTQGLENDPYTFSVENNGTMNAKYSLYLEDEELEDGEVRMNDSNVKIYLVKNNEESEAKLLSSVIKEEKRVLDEDIIIEPRETNNYSLRLWIDGDSSQEEVANKVFKARIKLEAVQTENVTKINIGEDATIQENETHIFNATITPRLSNTSKLKWCSSNNIVTEATTQGRCNDAEYEIVSCYGHTTCEVVGINSGETIITIRSGNTSDSAILTVNRKIQYLYKNGNEYTDITGGWDYNYDSNNIWFVNKNRFDVTKYTKICAKYKAHLIAGDAIYAPPSFRLYNENSSSSISVNSNNQVVTSCQDYSNSISDNDTRYFKFSIYSNTYYPVNNNHSKETDYLYLYRKYDKWATFDIYMYEIWLE